MVTWTGDVRTSLERGICHGDCGHQYRPIIYDTEECGYSEGLDRLVQLYREFRRDRQTRFGDNVEHTNKGMNTRNTSRALGKRHHVVANSSTPRDVAGGK